MGLQRPQQGRDRHRRRDSKRLSPPFLLPGKPEFPAVDGKGTVFDNIEDKSEIVRLDAHARSSPRPGPPAANRPPAWPSTFPGRRLFPVCDGKRWPWSTPTAGKVLATPAIGDGPDAAGWSAKHKLAFASCGEGVLAVVDAAKPGYPTIETLPTQRGARTMAYDPATDRIYLVTAEFGPRPAPTAENPRAASADDSRQLYSDRRRPLIRCQPRNLSPNSRKHAVAGKLGGVFFILHHMRCLQTIIWMRSNIKTPFLRLACSQLFPLRS